MARGKPHSEETRAQVMAALMAGQGITQIASQYKLPERTVRKWREEQFAEICRKKSERLDDLTFNYLSSLLTTLRAQAEHVADKRYVQKQPASEIAMLHGVMADKALRIFEAIERAGQEPASGGAESAE